MLETTTVGSLPKPEYLAETEQLWPAWHLSGKALEQAKKRATVEWLRHKEDADYFRFIRLRSGIGIP